MGRREPAVLRGSPDHEISRYHLCVYNGRYQFFLGRSKASGRCTYQRMYIYIFLYAFELPVSSRLAPTHYLSLVPPLPTYLLFLLWALPSTQGREISFFFIFHLLYFLTSAPFFVIALRKNIYRLICELTNEFSLTAT